MCPGKKRHGKQKMEQANKAHRLIICSLCSEKTKFSFYEDLNNHLNLVHGVILIPLILCFLNNKFILSMKWTKESEIPESDEKDSIDATACPEEFQDFCHRKSSSLEKLFEIYFDKKYGMTNALSKNKRVASSSLHDSFNNGPCQCGMTFRPMDLGSSVFPRYFNTGVCKKNTCGIFHRCHPKKFRMQILKRKDFESELTTELEETHGSAFPESLQEDWIPDYVNIVIGCECLPKKI